MRRLIWLLILTPLVGLAQDSASTQNSNKDLKRARYYELRELYKNGIKKYSDMPFLVNSAKELRDDDLANSVAQDYIDNFLLHLKDDSLYTKEHIEFIKFNTLNSRQRGFNFFYYQTSKIDNALNQIGYSQEVVKAIIYKEEIDSFFRSNIADGTEPEWGKIAENIRKKYNADYAEKTILDAQIGWGAYKRNWSSYCDFVVDKVERYGPFGPFSQDWNLNDNAWNIFLHSSEQSQLTKALSWSEKVLRISPSPNAEYFDTYANLLYKLGRFEEAIKVQEKALKLAPDAKDIQENIQKMRTRVPTWPID